MGIGSPNPKGEPSEMKLSHNAEKGEGPRQETVRVSFQERVTSVAHGGSDRRVPDGLRRSASSFASGPARYLAKLKQSYRWAWYRASKSCLQDADAVDLAEGNMTEECCSC